MENDRRFINIITVLTLIEAFIVILRFQLPINVESFPDLPSKMPGRWAIGDYGGLMVTLLFFSVLAIAYRHRYWITAVTLNCIAVFSENIRSIVVRKLHDLINISLSYLSYFMASVDLLLLLVSVMYLFKFRKLESYPRIYGQFNTGSK